MNPTLVKTLKILSPFILSALFNPDTLSKIHVRKRLGNFMLNLDIMASLEKIKEPNLISYEDQEPFK